MAPRPYWKGHLRLSLVSCPIELYPATSEREKISFNQLNSKIGNRIKYKKVDAATGEYLFSIDAKTQNVITAIDPKTGAKRIDMEKWPDPNRRADICPAVSGARSWPALSYNSQTTRLYMPLVEWCNSFGPEGGSGLLTSGVGIQKVEHPDAAADNMMGRLQAVDVAGRKMGWVHNQRAPLSTSTR